MSSYRINVRPAYASPSQAFVAASPEAALLIAETMMDGTSYLDVSRFLQVYHNGDWLWMY